MGLLRRRSFGPPALAISEVRAEKRRIGVMLPNWIGDAVMATPALRAVRRHYGREVDVVGIMSPMIADVLNGKDFFDTIIPYQRRTRDRGIVSVASQIRRLSLESLILLPNSFSSALLAWLGRVPQRIGYGRYGRSPLLTTSLAAPRVRGKPIPVSAVDYYRNLVHSIGCPVDDDPTLELAVTSADRTQADRILGRLSFDSSRPLVTLNNGGGYGAAKRWPLEYVIRLSQVIVAETEANVLIVCGSAERPDTARIKHATTSPRIQTLADVEPSIGLTKACVERSDVLVTTDSGVRHFAAAFDVPCVTLFGPSDPAWSENYHTTEQQLRVNLPCSPCGRRVCPLNHHRCLRDVSVDQVFRAVLRAMPPSDETVHLASHREGSMPAAPVLNVSGLIR